MKKTVPAIIVALLFSISAYAAFPPISTASWHSNLSKVEISEEPETQEEIEGKVYIIVSEPFRLSDYVKLVEEDEQGEQKPSDEVVNDIGLDTDADDHMNGTAIYEEEDVIEDKPVSDTEE